MQLRVTIDGEASDITIRPSSLVAFERHYGTTWADVEKDPKIEHVFFLAWDASKRQKLHDLEFLEWLDGCDDIDPVDEPDPTEAASSSS
jgi:hypothetical protein